MVQAVSSDKEVVAVGHSPVETERQCGKNGPVQMVTSHIGVGRTRMEQKDSGTTEDTKRRHVKEGSRRTRRSRTAKIRND